MINTKPLLSGLVLALVLAFANPVVHAHEDARLNAWLSEQPVAVTAHFDQAQIYAQLGNLWTHLGDDARSKKLVEKSKAAAAKVRDTYVQDVLTGHLANELASSGNFDVALKKLNEVKDTEVWVKTSWKLISKLAKAKEEQRATELLRLTEERTRSVDDLLVRAELLSGTGAAYRYINKAKGENLVYEAYGMAQMLADPYEKGVMLNEAGAHLVDIGHRERAQAVFEDVDRLAPTIQDPLQQAQVLAMLGGEMAEKNMREQAVSALDKGRVVASKLPDGEARAAVLSEIARNYGQSHRFEPGIAVAEGIADPYHRIEGFIRIAKNMARVGQKENAYDLLERSAQEAKRIQSPYRQATVLRKIASEWIDAKDKEKARSFVVRAEQLISTKH